MSKVKLFKEVKRGAKKTYENSYYNGKQRIHYECVIVASEDADAYMKKGFHQGLPTGIAPAKEEESAKVEDNGTDDSEGSSTEAST